MYNSIKITRRLPVSLSLFLGRNQETCYKTKRSEWKTDRKPSLIISVFFASRTFIRDNPTRNKGRDACWSRYRRILVSQSSYSFIFSICLNFRGEWPGTLSAIVLRLQRSYLINVLTNGRRMQALTKSEASFRKCLRLTRATGGSCWKLDCQLPSI